MRRTVSNLSREMMVSRPTIYKALERLGINKRTGGEFTAGEWERLKTGISCSSENNKKKKTDAGKVANTKAAKNDGVYISGTDAATLKERLNFAKLEYDYNRNLIVLFQDEASAYIKEEGRTTMMSHNGTATSIPAVVNLDKYIKLNISLSKLISELENDLDMEVDVGDDPFE